MFHENRPLKIEIWAILKGNWLQNPRFSGEVGKKHKTLKTKNHIDGLKASPTLLLLLFGGQAIAIPR